MTITPACENVRKYKLLLKTHYETGINYLCITKRKNWESYTGSGHRWKNLLKSHPSRILTILIFSTDDIDELAIVCKYYNDLFNIPNNPDFANLVPELGYEGNQGNLNLWWEYTSEENKIPIIEKRKESTRKTCLEKYGKPHTMNIALNALREQLMEKYGVDNIAKVPEMKERQQKTWKENMIKNYGVDHNSKIPEVAERMRIGREKTMMERYGVKHSSQIEGMWERTKDSIEKTMMERYGVKNISQSPENRRTVGPKISTGLLRKEKVKCRYCDFESRQIYNHEDYCKNNPNRKTRSTIECPHCGKMADKMNANRWHFDNCKHKPKDN